MTFDDTDLIDSLIRDYGEYSERRRKAVLRCNTEYVADLDKRMRQTRAKLDVVMEAKQNEQYLSGEHELIQWANAGYPPVVEHERPLSGFGKKPQRLPRNIYDEKPMRMPGRVEERQEPDYIVPQNPTEADWRRVALRYAETGSKEDYKLMLTMVRLDHPVPNLWREPEPVKTTTKTSKPLTLEHFWNHQVRDYGWLVIFLVILAIVVGINCG
jgi:hypothetical protein